jgi:hypothetical protein
VVLFEERGERMFDLSVGVQGLRTILVALN